MFRRSSLNILNKEFTGPIKTGKHIKNIKETAVSYQTGNF
jgi:hypothetical protein